MDMFVAMDEFHALAVQWAHYAASTLDNNLDELLRLPGVSFVHDDKVDGLFGVFQLMNGERVLLEHPFHYELLGVEENLKYGLDDVESYASSTGLALAERVEEVVRKLRKRHDSVVVASRPPYTFPLRLQDGYAQACVRAPRCGITLRTQILLLPEV